jgi:hypothetical protein
LQWNNTATLAVEAAMSARNPLDLFSSWMALSSQAIKLGFEAQQVMALRMMRIAAGGSRGQEEAQLMVSEKMAAFAEAQAATFAGAMEGTGDHRLGQKVLNIYGKHVRGNRRRLAR